MLSNPIVRNIAIIQVLLLTAVIALLIPYISPLVVLTLVLIAGSMMAVVVLTARTQVQQKQDMLFDELLLHSFENSPVAVVVMKPSGELLRVNQLLVDLLGYSRSQLITMAWQQLVRTSDIEHFQLQWECLLSGTLDQLTSEVQLTGRRNNSVWCRVHLYLVRNELQQPLYMVANVENISSERAAIQAQRLWEQKFEQLLLPWQDLSAAWILDSNCQQIQFFCPGFTRLFGPPPKQDDIQHIIGRIHPDDQDKFRQILTNSSLASWELEFRALDLDGKIRHMLGRGSSVLDQFGKIEVHIGSTFDITDQVLQKQQLDSSVKRLNQSLTKLKHAYRKLNENARLDPLTGLYNRKALFNELTKEMKLYRRSRRNACLLFIDINDFKEINDQYGHVVGDKVLQQIGHHLQQHCRETDVIGRFGGDEIALLLRESNLDQAKQFHQSILEPGIPFSVDSHQLVVTLSCGFVQLHDHIATVEQWLNLADEQMYNHKSEQKAR